MTALVITVVVVVFAVVIVAMLARAIVFDMRDSLSMSGVGRAIHLKMDPIQKEIIRARVVSRASKERPGA